MLERPLLLFPTPEPADRKKEKSFPGGKIHKPDHQRQGQRLHPIFNQLQAAFESRSLEIQQTAAGIEPEQTLVIETVDGIDNFVNAVKKIEGLEWLAEFENDDIDPDDDFYNEENDKKKLAGRLYLIMTNHRALEELLSLWRRYQADPNMKFDHGFAKFRDVFLQLKNIRRWDVQDRLIETGILETWKEDLTLYGDKNIPCELELWYRNSDEKRLANEKYIAQLLSQENGRIIGQSVVIPEISYHGILIELPAQAIKALISNPTTNLTKCDSIMFFRPVGQVITGEPAPNGEEDEVAITPMPLPSQSPVVAVFDGVPLLNHHLLSDRIIFDDPENWAADYQATERIHGTSMSSLVIHGDLNARNDPLNRHIYVRPIMKPIQNWHSTPRPENIPSDCLAIDLIHRAIKRLFEGEEGQEPVAPTIKVINLSIGDKSRQFIFSMSPFAKLLDWLSFKYGVLFIVSAGNHPAEIQLPVSKQEFDALHENDREKIIIKELYKNSWQRRLLSPAETINGLTVGSTHDDNATIDYLGNRFDPFTNVLPSPLSAFGGGYRRSIKPDILYYGGKQLYDLPLLSANPVKIKPAVFKISPGCQTASPGRHPGDLTATSHSCGSSNATALISRASSICHDSLQQIFDEQIPDIDYSTYNVPLLKAMLVHGCSWDEKAANLSSILRDDHDSRKIRSLVGRWTGYGAPDIDRVLDCTEQRATLLGFGHLADGDAHIFKLPLPSSLDARLEWRRLTTTLAWITPIEPNTQKYRVAAFWFDINKNNLTIDRADAEWRSVKRGTVQHEVFEGKSADPFLGNAFIEIKVNCRSEVGKIKSPIPYGLVVSFEVSEGVDIDVYNEIRTKITPVLQISQPIETA